MMIRQMSAAVVLTALFLSMLPGAVSATAPDDEQVGELSHDLVLGEPAQSDAALAKLVARGERDVVPALVLAIRFRRNEAAIQKALTALTGETIKTWKEAMLWQEAHPEV
ncbi:MAG: hypothetical protein ACR2OM_15420, partial [Aestuariivirgaceae bacterium]